MATTIVEETDRLADAAVRMIEDGMVVGLGSGRAATAFVRALGERVAAGLRIRGVPTSRATRGPGGEVGDSAGGPR